MFSREQTTGGNNNIVGLYVNTQNANIYFT